MDIRPIRTEEDLTWAIDEITRYFEHEPAPGSPDADRFEVLATLIDTYENKHWPIPDADPIVLLEYIINEAGRSQAELAELLGSRSRASEVLSRERPLSLDMIRKISTAWHLPVELLIAPYALKTAKPKVRSKTSAKTAVKRPRKSRAA